MADKHVVFGGTSRLREEMKNALAVLEGGMLAVLTGCPAEMIGDDVGAMVKELTAQGERVVAVPTAGFHGPAHEGHARLLAGLLAQLAPAPTRADRPLVNLFGIAPGWIRAGWPRSRRCRGCWRGRPCGQSDLRPRGRSGVARSGGGGRR
ncbi:nitrogenase component 1 [Rhodobacter capsulatus]|uniref:nitrogenase component 1 n=1 Tax=Rhodobacter capsulatus TaxID=1061 RepID=UPI0040274FE2